MQKELVFIGLGRMGLAMCSHLVEQNFTVYGYDVDADARAEGETLGIETADSIADAIGKLSGRKIVWLMVPAKFVDDVLAEVIPHIGPDDIVVDGGNSFFKDTARRGVELKQKDIHYIDCGTSGGVDGARHGASLMVGGETAVVKDLEHIFTALATENGYGHVGGPAAGHFVKMVHNGIEYGMMGALAEGLQFVEAQQEELDINVAEVLKPYENGSIIASSLMSWLATAYRTEGYLDAIAGEVPRGETEIEMEYIAKHDQTPVLQAALDQRKETRTKSSRVGTLISAMRNQFGGHKTIKQE